jgi:hypothetical protein
VVALKREKFKGVRPLPGSGRDDRELKFEGIGEDRRRKCRQGRCRDWENPFGSSHFKVRANDWDPIRAKHYGQRPHRPHKQAGHMTAPDQCCSNVRKFLPRRRPHMTHS